MSVNYRHAFHAGNFADVLKHGLLVRLVRALQRKEKGFLFIDTHAGRGRYDLSLAAEGESQARTPEWPSGIGRLWDRPGAPPEIRDYVELVRAFDLSRGNLSAGPRFYPGSPRIAQLLSRPQDRLELWERHPDECAALKYEFDGESRVAVHKADGYGAMRACLPPVERRALVLIDPPFESADEWTEIAQAVGEGLRRFPAGVYAVWYPLSDRAKDDRLSALLQHGKVPSLAVELSLDPRAPGMRGCGVVLINPPWRFEKEVCSILDYLRSALYLYDGAQSGVRWIVST